MNCMDQASNHFAKTLRKEMDARGWGVAELAAKSRLTRRHVAALLDSEWRVTQLSAVALGEAFGTSASKRRSWRSSGSRSSSDERR